MNELALFAGAGGGILGGKLLGWRTICAVEIDAYCRRVLLARQRDGILEPFPIWDDIRTFDGNPWRGSVDVISGGFPCQDISVAGKGAGITGERSGLWKEMARIVREVGPRFVFVENSPMLISRGLGVVLGDLATMGYDARWGVLGAHHVGAPHRRDRIWIVADSDSVRREQLLEVRSGNGTHESRPEDSWQKRRPCAKPTRKTLRDTEPFVGRVANELADQLGDSHMTKVPIDEAEPLAKTLVESLAPHCEEILICGSIRRHKPLVSDIELVFVPKLGTKPDPTDLFGAEIEADFASDKIEELLARGVITKRLNAEGSPTWGKRNKYAVHVETGIAVDFFSTLADCLPCYTVCRTGCAEFNTLICDLAIARRLKWNPTGRGYSDRITGRPSIVCATEREVLQAVGLDWIEPWDRTAETAQRLRRKLL